MAYSDDLLEALSPTPTNYSSPAQIQRNRAFAQELLNSQQMPKAGVYTWANGLDHVVRSVMAGLSDRQANQQEAYNAERSARNEPSISQGGQPIGGAAPPTDPGLPTTATPTKWSGDPADDVGFIKSHEGFSATPYPDGHQTSIGYGTRAQPGDKSITPEEGHARLMSEKAQVDAFINQNVQTPLTPGQRTALTSFGYNTGVGALAKTIPDVNKGDWKAVTDRMGQYIRSDGKVNNGLINRRSEEISLAMKPPQAPRDPGQGAGPAPAQPPVDPRFPPIAPPRTLPPGAPPGAGVPPPPNASLGMPPGPTGGMMMPASFNPSAPQTPTPVPAAQPAAMPPAVGAGQAASPAQPAGMQTAQAGGRDVEPLRLPIPPGVPSDHQIQEWQRSQNPELQKRAETWSDRKAQMFAPQQVKQPDGTIYMGSPYTGWQKMPFTANPDIIKSPLKFGGNEVEQQLVPQGPGQPMKEINPMLAQPPGPQGGVQPTSGIQPAMNTPAPPGAAPGIPSSVPGLQGFPGQPPNSPINQMIGMGANNEIAKNTEMVAQKGQVATGQKLIDDAQAKASTAPGRLANLGVLREALDDPNISGGVLGEQYQHLKSAVKQLTGIDMGGVGAGERISKVNTKLAFADTAEATKRPAYMEILMQTKANPGLLNSVETSKYLVDIARQQAIKDQDIAQIGATLQNPREFAHARDEYYKMHPFVSPLTGKSLGDRASAASDDFELAIRSKNTPGQIDELRRNLGLSHEDATKAEAMARERIANGAQGATPVAAPAEGPIPHAGTISDPEVARKLRKGTPFRNPQGRELISPGQ
jgi:lysozyme